MNRASDCGRRALGGGGAFLFFFEGVSLGRVRIVTGKSQASPRAGIAPVLSILLLLDLVHRGYRRELQLHKSAGSTCGVFYALRLLCPVLR